jgi:hypothetical protein
VDVSVHNLGALATIVLLFLAVVHVLLLARHRRQLENRLGEARAEVEVLRHRLAEATRPPAQFARMRLREEAIFRFARLRRAVPRRGRGSERSSAAELASTDAGSVSDPSAQIGHNGRSGAVAPAYR